MNKRIDIKESGRKRLEPGAKKSTRHLSWWVCLLLILAPLAVGFFCLCIGRLSIPPQKVLDAIVHGIGDATGSDGTFALVIWNMRLPRILLALLVGGGLSVAGVAYQSLFSNPLATPDTLGVASGASLGAALALLLGAQLFLVQLSAMAFGFLAVGITFLVGIGGRRNEALITVVLSGMVISSLFTAMVSLVKYTADTDSQLPAIEYWLMGSLSSAGYRTLSVGAPLILLGCIILFLIRWRLNILTLSEEEARATGTRVRLVRLFTVLSATMITASCIAMCGQVGWVGLLIPHICRMLFGSDHVRLVPATISLGAIFMVVVDTLARSAISSEIPISILTAIIGAPFFIHLLRKTGGWYS